VLTFDDGPSIDPDLTPKVLDVLEKYNISAPILERAKRLGCEFGNHLVYRANTKIFPTTKSRCE